MQWRSLLEETRTIFSASRRRNNRKLKIVKKVSACSSKNLLKVKDLKPRSHILSIPAFEKAAGLQKLRSFVIQTKQMYFTFNLFCTVKERSTYRLFYIKIVYFCSRLIIAWKKLEFSRAACTLCAPRTAAPVCTAGVWAGKEEASAVYMLVDIQYIDFVRKKRELRLINRFLMQFALRAEKKKDLLLLLLFFQKPRNTTDNYGV